MTKYIDNSLSYYYQNGWSHTSLANRSYQYVGIYANGDNLSTTANGKLIHSLDAEYHSHHPYSESQTDYLVPTGSFACEAFANICEYQGKEYAFNVSESSNTQTGGSIYDGNSYTAIWPVAYLDLNNEMHPFTSAEAANPAFSYLIRKSGNAYTSRRI